MTTWTVVPPWPKERYPSGQELAQWLRLLPIDEAAEACSRLVEAQEAQTRCFIRHGCCDRHDY